MSNYADTSRERFDSLVNKALHTNAEQTQQCEVVSEGSAEIKDAAIIDTFPKMDEPIYQFPDSPPMFLGEIKTQYPDLQPKIYATDHPDYMRLVVHSMD